MIHSLCNITR